MASSTATGAGAEHDILTATLRGAGVEVLDLPALVAGALQDEAGSAVWTEIVAADLSGARRRDLVDHFQP